MVRYFTAVISFLISFTLTAAPDRLEDKLKELDSYIESREQFDNLKLKRIGHLQQELSSGGGNRRRQEI